MRSKHTLALLLSVLLLVLSACTPTDSPPKSTDPVTPSATMPTDTKAFPISFKYTAGEVSRLKSGRLNYTITDARLVSSTEALANINGFRSDASVCFYGDSYEHCDLTLRYPDFILQDGSFYEGVHLLVLDITVTSEDAAAYTRRDLDEDGYPLGPYDDPSLFRADGILYLQDTHIDSIVRTDPDGTEYSTGPACWVIDYYSRMNERAENYMVFRLMPGESISFQIGFLVVDINDGGEMDLNTLCLTQVAGDPEAFITHLDLKPKEE